MEILLAHSADPNGKYWNLWTAVHEAASIGDCEILTLLLDAGGDSSSQDDAGLTSVFVAAQYGKRNALLLLLRRSGGALVL